MRSLHSLAAFIFSAAAACGGSDVSAITGPASVLFDHCSQASSLRANYYVRQGQQLQGFTGASFVIQGARSGCQPITGLAVSQGNLTGSLAGRTLASADFQGTALQFLGADGTKGEVAVTQVQTDSMDGSGQTALFALMAIEQGTGAVVNVCAPDADGLAAAIPIAGSYDASGAFHEDGPLSFACTSGVIAKCIRWGYRPWQSAQGTSLASYHQACTRMARADYCGTGETHTQPGTQIDVYDSLGVHAPSQPLGLLFEASWTPQGAYCIARERWLTLQGVLSDSCKQQFELVIQSSPINSTDLCLAHRIGSSANAALLSDRTGIQIGL